MGCATAQQIDSQYLESTAQDLSTIDTGSAYECENLIQAGHELNMSLSVSLSATLSSQILEVPEFEKQEYHNPNIYAAPRLHEVVCEYTVADEMPRFYGSQFSALELQTGTLVQLSRLTNSNELAVNAFVSHLLVSVNLQELSLKVLDFQPNVLQCAMQEYCLTAQDIIDGYGSFPTDYAAQVLRRAVLDLQEYHTYGVNINAISARNIAVSEPLETRFFNFYAATRGYFSHILPYAGFGDQFMLGSLAFELLTGKPVYFEFKWTETLLLSEQFPFASDYLDSEFAEFCSLCETEQSIDGVLASNFMQKGIDMRELSELGEEEVFFGDEDTAPWIEHFLLEFKAECEDSDDFDEALIEEQIQYSDDFFSDRIGCCGVLIGVE